MRVARITASLAILSAVPAIAAAQTVRVAATDSLSGVPLKGALISLVTVGGGIVGTVLSDASGNATIAASDSGVFRIVVRRIGFSPFASPSIHLARGDVIRVPLRVSSAQVMLTMATNAIAGNRCNISGTAALASLTLWQEIHKSLESSELAAANDLSQKSILRYERLTTTDGKVLRDTSLELRAGARAFVTPDPSRLSADGYVRIERDFETSFFAPDARTLLSDEFARDHCFGVQPADNEHPGMVGLVFEPVRGRHKADIGGTLWVDAASSELRHIAFEYVNAPLRTDDRGTGIVRYAQSPSGIWFVSSWLLRVPRAGSWTTQSWLEVGGEVRENVKPVARSGSIVGVVYDSLHDRPLADAAVLLDRAIGATRTNAAGEFRIDDVAVGRHDIAVRHPALDSLGLNMLEGSVTVRADRSAVVAFELPDFLAFWRRYCWGIAAPNPRDAGILHGSVRDATPSHRQVDDVVTDVSVEWIVPGAATPVFGHLHVDTDRNGDYHVCGVPSNALVRVQAATPQLVGGSLSTVTAGRPVVALDMTLFERPRLTPRSLDELAKRPTIVGVVVDSSGNPVASARVGADGYAATRTDSAGRFEWIKAIAGTREVQVTAPGFAPWSEIIDVRERDTARVAVMLQSPERESPLRAAARRATDRIRAAFEQRRTAGVGAFLDTTQIARHGSLDGMFGAVRGLRVESVDGGFRVLDDAKSRGSDVCAPALYLDGRIATVADLAGVEPRDLAALEHYAERRIVPDEFRGWSTDCGVILLWSRLAFGE